jgi:hypothetical protein
VRPSKVMTYKRWEASPVRSSQPPVASLEADKVT